MDDSKENIPESEFTGEALDGIGNAVPNPRQSVDDWCKLHPPAFVESYLRNELCFCFKIRCWLGEVDSEDYYALFSNFARGGIAEACDGDGIASDGLSILFSGADGDAFSQTGNGAGDNQELVFIKVVKLLDNVKHSVVRSLARVRLYRANEFLSGRGDAIYQSARTGVIEFFDRGANGELVAMRNNAPILDNERTKKVIQTGAQVMNNLACENREPRRDSGVTDRYKRILQPIVLMPSNNLIRFGLAPQEDRDFRVEILDVFFGPLNFCPAAEKKIAHGAPTPDIDVTPAMAEAGLSVAIYLDFDAPDADRIAGVAEIYKAMCAARSSSASR